MISTRKTKKDKVIFSVVSSVNLVDTHPRECATRARDHQGSEDTGTGTVASRDGVRRGQVRLVGAGVEVALGGTACRVCHRNWVILHDAGEGTEDVHLLTGTDLLIKLPARPVEPAEPSVIAAGALFQSPGQTRL